MGSTRSSMSRRAARDRQPKSRPRCWQAAAQCYTPAKLAAKLKRARSRVPCKRFAQGRCPFRAQRPRRPCRGARPTAFISASPTPLSRRARSLRGPASGCLRTRLPALAAEQLGADLIGLGPVFATTSKANPDPVVGLTGLRSIMARTTLPIVAIGGVDLTNINQVAETGVPLVACIGAICKAEDPRSAAAALHASVIHHAAEC